MEHLDIMDRWDWQEIFAKAGLLLLLVTGCGKKEDFRSVLLVSHAGMGLNIQNSIYHDNSREALDMACSMIGCDGVEVDVQLSKDGELWLYHDATLESESNGEGCVPELTRDELEDIRYNSVHKEKLCPLSEISNEELSGKELFLDLRHLNACAQTFVSVDAMINQISKLSFVQTKCWVITNYNEWIYPLKQANFKVLFQLEESAAVPQETASADGYVIRNSIITSDQVQEIHDSGKKLFIFDVRSPKGIRSALGKHPDGVLSDDIRAAIIEKN